MRKLDYALLGLLICISTAFYVQVSAVTQLPKSSSDPAPVSAKPQVPFFDPPRPHFTKELEAVAYRDQFKVTRQKCEGSLCVTCLVSTEPGDRHYLGEVWTYCPYQSSQWPDQSCHWLQTTDELNAGKADLGACERDEVPALMGAL